MVISSFQTENLALLDAIVNCRKLDVLLDVLGQTRHEVVAVFVEGLALGLEAVDGVHDGALERLGGVTRGELGSLSAHTLLPCYASACAYPHVGRLRVLASDLLGPQSRRRECARGGGAGDRGQWPADCKPHCHCVCIEAEGPARCSGRGAGNGWVVRAASLLRTDVHQARLPGLRLGIGVARAYQSLAVAPAPTFSALHHPPTPNHSASLSLTRPAFVCVLVICQPSATTPPTPSPRHP